MNGSPMTAASHAASRASLQSPSVKLASRWAATVRLASRSTEKGLAQDQTRRRDARPRGDQHVLDVGHRVHRGPAQLPHTLCDAVHAVDVGLTELAPVRVDGKPASHLDRTAGNEVLGFTLAAESQLLQLNQGERGEVVVQ